MTDRNNSGTISTAPFQDQRPGTSGLRKKTRRFMERHYLENFVQSVFDVVREDAAGDLASEALVVGGDGRYFNRPAIQTIVRMAAANGFGRILLAKDGLLSTPAMSAVIRRRGARGGIILSASHNPGGADGDFGVKYNVANGGPAPEEITEQIYRRTLEIRSYRTVTSPDLDLSREGETRIANAQVTVFDPLRDYTDLMEELFDFDRIRAFFQNGFRMLFDAMHGATGPYARHILETKLGASEGTVLRGDPLEDFGGLHPDPNLVRARDLVARMAAKDAPDFAAACDGDGDRNLILGRGLFVSPGDSLAVIAENAASHIRGYRQGLTGIARSMPTSTAADRVARALGVPCYETPTGWKFFGHLLDAGLCTLCGEESFGTGSNHLREKDGLWAVLCWIAILAGTGQPLNRIVRDHWRRFGRSYYQRHDYEGLDRDRAQEAFGSLRGRLPSLVGTSVAGAKVVSAEEFCYTDPVDGRKSPHQGLRLATDDGSRIVWRLSGTGTEGATLRLYLERHRNDGGEAAIEEVLKPLAEAAVRLAEIKDRCRVERPTVIT